MLRTAPPTTALELGLKPSSWTQSALCAQVDRALFFPEKGRDTVTAKKVCARCPVQTPCLETALRRGEHYGVWGGTSERQRRRLMARRKLA